MERPLSSLLSLLSLSKSVSGWRSGVLDVVVCGSRLTSPEKLLGLLSEKGAIVNISTTSQSEGSYINAVNVGRYLVQLELLKSVQIIAMMCT